MSTILWLYSGLMQYKDYNRANPGPAMEPRSCWGFKALDLNGLGTVQSILSPGYSGTLFDIFLPYMDKNISTLL